MYLFKQAQLSDKDMNAIESNLSTIDQTYDLFFTKNPEWDEVESKLYNEVDELIGKLKEATEKYAEYLRIHTE